MDPGKLDRRITLETSTTAPDDFGQEIETWGTSREVWASVRYQTPREVFAAEQKSAMQTAIFTIRYLDGISAAKNRVLYKGLTYNITGVTEYGRREFLNLIGEAENNG